MATEREQHGARGIPSVSAILHDPAVRAAADGIAEPYLVAVIRTVVEAERAQIRAGGSAHRARIIERVCGAIARLSQPRLTPVINATGVILHTNLGRAPVSHAAATAMQAVASSYVPLEMERETAARGGRMAELDALLHALTGCEAALVVNNNAAATMLVLAAVLTPERVEVLVSRAEAVEIGGSFRIPDILRQSGATLVDVGTTNRTYFSDYERALSPQTAAILKVHTSNFRVQGFVHATAAGELVPLAEARGIPIIDDLGSGALVDTAAFGLATEPTLQASVASGAHLICASGDKLLGGPQAGIILGRRAWVAQCAAHPFARAVRADKTTLAGLSETLRHYLRDEHRAEIPVWRMIATEAEALHARCAAIRARLADAGVSVVVRSSVATVGGGSVPGAELPSFALALDAETARARGLSLDAVARALRLGRRPVIPRVEHDAVWLDLRAVLPEDDDALFLAVRDLSRDVGASCDGSVGGIA
ncbi:MAG: L-seryl-tRNA(Sec) selenium transferase [Chloroflexota bacterium]|nr:L-seryl-tRNA(Sec) selenium transferase [Chloroflexota bacterium]